MGKEEDEAKGMTKSMPEHMCLIHRGRAGLRLSKAYTVFWNNSVIMKSQSFYHA